MKFIDYICCSVVTVKHKCLLKYNKFSCFTFLSGEAAWLRSVLRGKLRSTNLIKINTHGIASYYFRRSLWGIIIQTDSFQKFSDFTLKATFIIFFGKEQAKNNFKYKTAAKSSKQDLSSYFWKTLFLTISNISFLHFDFLRTVISIGLTAK